MHPFAKFIQILGKVRQGMGPLTREDICQAMEWWLERHLQEPLREAI